MSMRKSEFFSIFTLLKNALNLNLLILLKKSWQNKKWKIYNFKYSDKKIIKKIILLIRKKETTFTI